MPNPVHNRARRMTRNVAATVPPQEDTRNPAAARSPFPGYAPMPHALSDESARLLARISEALAPFPDARLAVAESLRPRSSS